MATNDKKTGGRKPLSEAEKAAKAANPESKADRFKRLGKARTTAAIQKISLLRALSSTSQYEYTAEQVAAMFKAIRTQVDNVESAFAAKAKEGKPEFDFG